MSAVLPIALFALSALAILRGFQFFIRIVSAAS